MNGVMISNKMSDVYSQEQDCVDLLQATEEEHPTAPKTEEIWQFVPGFSAYQASTFGRIRRHANLKILSQQTTPAGYKCVHLYNGKPKYLKVHVVIAMTFIENPQTKPTGNHINHIRDDNRVQSLEWATVAEQNRKKRPKARKEQYTHAVRKVWKCHIVTGERLELFDSVTLAAKAVTKANGMSDTCAVALKRLGSNGYVKQSAYGFTWEYETHEIIPGEIWIDLRPDILEGVEGYAISSEGRIRNHKGRVGEPYAGTDGYMRFRVYPHTFMAHRLVAKAFLLNLCGKPQVNHKDGNKNNCRLDNLEWATQAENSQHAHDTGRNKSSISVRQLTADGEVVSAFKSIAAASRVTNIGCDSIRDCIHQRKDLAGGFKCERVEMHP